jgi:DNA polymerase III epsilon subunit-like protein
MTDRYIVFDVETPNSRNNRMSAIGISIIENGEIIERGTHEDLINLGGKYFSLYTGMFELE